MPNRSVREWLNFPAMSFGERLLILAPFCIVVVYVVSVLWDTFVVGREGWLHYVTNVFGAIVDGGITGLIAAVLLGWAGSRRASEGAGTPAADPGSDSRPEA